MGKYYITTTLPYVNAKPHVGFAMEIVRADVLARLHRQIGDEVFFNTGTDEHGQKIYQKAVEAKKTPQEYCDEFAAKFGILKEKLNLSYDNFIRTTDAHHLKAAQEFWKRSLDNGDIYKKIYKIKYCVGCELEKTDSELVNGKCPLHPSREIELIEEENYFFKFSKYQKPLLELYERNSELVIPSFRLKEMKLFVESGLQDFSISRVKAKMPWGVEIPGDDTQVMYVWFDALVNYISALGWPEDGERFDDWWPGTQIAGKDNLRQQTAMWQAMLMSAGLPTSKQIYVEGFVTAGGGVKMSKDLGNVVDPIEYVEKYGTDSLRYYLLAKIHPYEDSDFTRERFEDSYTADLANGIGNLCARISTMAEKSGAEYEEDRLKIEPKIIERLRDYRFDEAMVMIWSRIKDLDTLINEREVWKLKGDGQITVLKELIRGMRQTAEDLKPFLPETALKIEAVFKEKKIRKSEILFPRLEK